MSEDIVLEGWLSILSALDGESRSLKIIYLQRNKKCASFARLLRRARQRQVPVNVVSRGFIEARTSGASHGGAIALAGPRRYTPLDNLGREAAVPLIVMLDGIEDPFNFGQAIRAIYAAGADGLVVTNRNWGHAAGVVARASAGTSERMPTARVEAAAEAVAHFRTRGLTIACTARWPGAIPLYGADLSQPLLLLIGGSGGEFAVPCCSRPTSWCGSPAVPGSTTRWAPPPPQRYWSSRRCGSAGSSSRTILRSRDGGAGTGANVTSSR